MMRVLTVFLLGFTLLAGLVVADDTKDKPEPPVRLKKKNKPAADEAPKPPAAEEKKPEPPMPPRAKDGKEDPEPAPAETEDEKEVLNRISRNMRSAEDRLANRELGEGTEQLHRDILKDLDLFLQMQNQQNSDSSSSPDQQQDAQNQPNQQSRQKQQGQQNQQARGNRRGSRRQMARGNQQQGNQQQGNQQEQMAKSGGQNPGGGNAKKEEGANKIADIYKDVWGHLPESLRGEMNAYSREHFMAKYKDLIEQYYSSISEKGRRKGD